MKTGRDLDWLITKAYFIEHGTNPRFVNARHSDNFTELLTTAMSRGALTIWWVVI